MKCVMLFLNDLENSFVGFWEKVIFINQLIFHEFFYFEKTWQCLVPIFATIFKLQKKQKKLLQNSTKKWRLLKDIPSKLSLNKVPLSQKSKPKLPSYLESQWMLFSLRLKLLSQKQEFNKSKIENKKCIFLKITMFYLVLQILYISIKVNWTTTVVKMVKIDNMIILN